MTNMVSQKKVFWASRSVKDCLNSDENGRPGTDQPENQTDLKTTSNKSKRSRNKAIFTIFDVIALASCQRTIRAVEAVETTQ